MTRHEQWKVLDLFRRKAFVRLELRKILLKTTINLKSQPLGRKYHLQFRLVNLPNIASRNKLQNRCATSGRNKNVLRRVRSSRFVFRHKAHFTYFPGCRRAS